MRYNFPSYEMMRLVSHLGQEMFLELMFIKHFVLMRYYTYLHFFKSSNFGYFLSQIVQRSWDFAESFVQDPKQKWVYFLIQYSFSAPNKQNVQNSNAFVCCSQMGAMKCFYCIYQNWLKILPGHLPIQKLSLYHSKTFSTMNICCGLFPKELDQTAKPLGYYSVGFKLI